MDALKKANLEQSRTYLAALQAEAQSLRQSEAEAKARLEAVQAAIVQNGEDQARERQKIATAEVEELENPA